MSDEARVDGGDDRHLDTDQIQIRREKLTRLIEAGKNPFERHCDPTHHTDDIIASFDTMDGQMVRIAGRLRSMRIHGKATFSHLQDESGRIQLFARQDHLGLEPYEEFKDLDLGDLIGVEGRVFRTKRGEISVEVDHFVLVAKALRPLPEKWHGLKDVEQRYRRRYLDLIVNEQSKQTFVKRSQIIESLRDTLSKLHYIEVETPMLHPIAGGANARPFETYHNALEMPLYLRIAPELYLKRLLVGGFQRVFELGKVFRNEGISTRHNPEYTLLEAYEAYGDYETIMNLTETLIVNAARAATGQTVIQFQDREIDLTPPWERITMVDAVKKYGGLNLHGLTPEQTIRAVKDSGVHLKPTASAGEAIMEAFEQLAEKFLIQPTFLTEHPVEVSPLAKRKISDPGFTERFELYINGWEIANAFSELNDPIDQRERFEQQAKAKEQGDDEAHAMDDDFVEALEYAMPPAGGLGIGVDRLVMLLTNSASIRDVILFPHMRPRQED